MTARSEVRRPTAAPCASISSEQFHWLLSLLCVHYAVNPCNLFVLHVYDEKLSSRPTDHFCWLLHVLDMPVSCLPHFAHFSKQN